MSTRNVEDVMNELYTVLEGAWRLPLSGGRAMVDGDEVRALLDEMRDNFPSQMRQANEIVASRQQLLSEAKREAEGIVRAAEERQKRMVNQHEITKRAKEEAEALRRRLDQQEKESRRAIEGYVTELLTRCDDTLQKSLNELRATRQEFKQSRKNLK